MIQKDARNTLHHIWDANKSKYTDGERSLGTLVTKTHVFLVFFLTNGRPSEYMYRKQV